MSKPKLTPWYPASVKPVRKGVYQVRVFPHFDGWRRWEGGRWMATSADRQIAEASTRPGCVKVEWRGLAEPPK